MMNSDHPVKPATLSAALVADRMGLTTRQLQDLRLRGIGPQIVQQGLTIHYELVDVQEIERHEAMLLIEQVLASERPLTLLRALADLGGFKRSPILQQISLQPVPDAAAPQSEPTAPAPANPDLSIIRSSPASTTAPAASPPTPSSLTLVPPDTTTWHLVYTKAQQEDIALVNLERQGYTCYLPRLRIDKIRRRKAEITIEPMFPRYLFVRLDLSGQGKSWSPIRSTVGVQQLIYFGSRAAQVDDALIDWLRRREAERPTEAMFKPGEAVVITDGPFAGIEAIYQTANADRRAMILLEILSKPVRMQIDSGRLRKIG